MALSESRVGDEQERPFYRVEIRSDDFRGKRGAWISGLLAAACVAIAMLRGGALEDNAGWLAACIGFFLGSGIFVHGLVFPRVAWFEVVHDEIRWHRGRQFVRIPRRRVILLNLEDGLEANQTTVTLADTTELRLPDEILRYDLSNVERLGVAVCEAWPEVRVVRGLRSQGYKPFQPKS